MFENTSIRCFLQLACILLQQGASQGGVSNRGHLPPNPILQVSRVIKAQTGDDVTLTCQLNISSKETTSRIRLQWIYYSYSSSLDDVMLEEEVASENESVESKSQEAHRGEVRSGEVFGEEVTRGGAKAELKDGNWSLHLENVEADQTGTYYCKVILENAEYEREVFLKVKERKDKSHETFIMERSGRNITLDCLDMENREEGSLAGATVWKKNGETIVVNGTKLNLIRVDKEDSGEYHCLVSGTVSKNITVQVRHAPIVETTLSTVKQHPGYPASLLCTVSSLPVPQIRWYLLSNSSNELAADPPQQPPLPIHQDLDTQIEIDGFKDGMLTSRLYFKNISLFNYGTYTCNASNELGEMSGVRHLMYSPVPVLESSPAVQYTPCTFLLLLLVVFHQYQYYTQ